MTAPPRDRWWEASQKIDAGLDRIANRLEASLAEAARRIEAAPDIQPDPPSLTAFVIYRSTGWQAVVRSLHGALQGHSLTEDLGWAHLMVQSAGHWDRVVFPVRRSFDETEITLRCVSGEIEVTGRFRSPPGGLT